MIGIYFSGTGNTQYCLEKFLSLYDANAEMIRLEDPHSIDRISCHEDIIFAYPVYYSNLPKLVHDFICSNSKAWQGKRIFIIATMGLFSGDGTGVSARLFKKYGAKIWGGLHLIMPDCICDVKALKRSPINNEKIIKKSEERISLAVYNLKNGKPQKNGLGSFSHFAGLFGQRLWFINKTREYSNKIQIDTKACCICGECVNVCPMKNLSLSQGKITTAGKCTYCYRCANQCPQKAITILGKQVVCQYSIYNFR
ncbi:EFR1 family ferrodoxin [Dielma fastidiosa]|uniref:EFR1 family ferrodoxin n=1 Tax=Dielma fastidiosa TaxID=1034346 RepID=UPI000EBD9D10|nr:EFR1 family ferrodoxin [Dielma fastidiosa]HAH92481.1 iron-sulfur protein [Dielma fastidiosa]